MRIFLLLFIIQVELDPNSGVFITLNPAGKGYGGRQKLPDNLKQLFRPVAMSRPDNELIAEVILYSEGFKDGEMLGKKIVAIFNLARYKFFSSAVWFWLAVCLLFPVCVPNHNLIHNASLSHHSLLRYIDFVDKFLPALCATRVNSDCVKMCRHVCVQGAVDPPAALRLGFACSEDSAEGLWQSAAASEEEPRQGQE